MVPHVAYHLMFFEKPEMSRGKNMQNCLPIQGSYGNFILKLFTADLAGGEEVRQLQSKGYELTGGAIDCFHSTDYDENHRLKVQGRMFRVALVTTRSMSKEVATASDVLKWSRQRYGDIRQLAGIIPRVREALSAEWMEKNGITVIVSGHAPIKDKKGVPKVLGCDRGSFSGDRRILYAGLYEGFFENSHIGHSTALAYALPPPW